MKLQIIKRKPSSPFCILLALLPQMQPKFLTSYILETFCIQLVKCISCVLIVHLSLVFTSLLCRYSTLCSWICTLLCSATPVCLRVFQSVQKSFLGLVGAVQYSQCKLSVELLPFVSFPVSSVTDRVVEKDCFACCFTHVVIIVLQ